MYVETVMENVLINRSDKHHYSSVELNFMLQCMRKWIDNNTLLAQTHALGQWQVHFTYQVLDIDKNKSHIIVYMKLKADVQVHTFVNSYKYSCFCSLLYSQSIGHIIASNFVRLTKVYN